MKKPDFINDRIQVDVTYTCSDGEKFNTPEEAEAHERALADPEYRFRKLRKLEERVLLLEGELALLKSRIECLEAHKQFFPQVMGNDDQYNKKLPAEPGSVVFGRHSDVGCYTITNENHNGNK